MTWRPTLHVPADALRSAVAPIGPWGLVLAPVIVAVELVCRLFAGWWRLTAPAVRWLNRHWIMWPLALPFFLVSHLFLWTLFGAMIGQWMPGIIGNGHAVGRATEAYIAVNILVMALVGVPQRRADDPVVLATGLQQRVLDAVMRVPGVPLLHQDLKRVQEGDRPRTRASRPKRVGESDQVIVKLPGGLDAAKIARENAGSVAGSLGLSADRVVLSTDRKESANTLVVRVLDVALEDRDMSAWPLPPAGSHPYFDGFTLGLDQYGDPATATLFEHSTLILGMAGAGKSWTVRTIAAAAALDPLVDLRIHTLKPTADFDPLGPAEAGHGGHSVAPVNVGEDLANIRRLREDLEQLKADISRRGKILRERNAEKLTRKIAADPALNMRPVVLIVDECHKGFQDKEHGTAIQELAVDIAKRARYVGISLVLASQEAGKDDIPRSVTANTQIGIALRLLHHQQVDNVLGAGAYKAGADVTKIDEGDAGRGIAYTRGLRTGQAAPFPKIKLYGTSFDALDAIAESAAADRAEWDQEHGAPAAPKPSDDGADEKPADLLDHVAKVQADRPVVARKDILAGLKELDAERYGAWETKDLSRELKGWGINPESGYAPGSSGKQAVLTLETLNAAIAAR